MQKDGKMLSLYGASTMDIGVFNREAAAYAVHMDESDAPIDRLVKYSLFLSRKDSNGSRIPTNAAYVDMALEIAAAKAKGIELVASSYDSLTNRPWDAVRDILEFQENLPKRRCRATLLRFNRDGEIEPVEDIVIAGEGWTRALGARHGYPIETSRDPCVVENLGNPSLSGRPVRGYWFVGPNPVGQQRLSLRGPNWDDEWRLDASVRASRTCSCTFVGALRLRRPLPEAYHYRAAEAHAKQA